MTSKQFITILIALFSPSLSFPAECATTKNESQPKQRITVVKTVFTHIPMGEQPQFIHYIEVNGYRGVNDARYWLSKKTKTDFKEIKLMGGMIVPSESYKELTMNLCTFLGVSSETGNSAIAPLNRRIYYQEKKMELLEDHGSVIYRIEIGTAPVKEYKETSWDE